MSDIELCPMREISLLDQQMPCSTWTRQDRNPSPRAFITLFCNDPSLPWTKESWLSTDGVSLRQGGGIFGCL